MASSSMSEELFEALQKLFTGGDMALLDKYPREQVQSALKHFLGRLDSHLKLQGRQRYGRSISSQEQQDQRPPTTASTITTDAMKFVRRKQPTLRTLMVPTVSPQKTTSSKLTLSIRRPEAQFLRNSS
jgi:hypothetical protein